MKKKFILLSLLGIVLAFGSCKEEAVNEITIYGNIVDQITGKALYNVLVQEANNVGGSGVTGNDGNYEITLPIKGASNGEFYLLASKDGYLESEYTLNMQQVDKNRRVRVDFQLKPLFQSFKITAYGVEASTLDFGIDPKLDKIAFLVTNDGTMSVTVEFNNSASWIALKNISNQRISSYSLAPNEGYVVYAHIDRSSLQIGDQMSYIYVSSSTLTKTLEVKAKGLGMPKVTNPILSKNSTAIYAYSSVTDTGGGKIYDKGFEYQYYRYAYPDGSDEYTCGPGDGSFQAGLFANGNTIKRVRAYAFNGVYTGYSEWVAAPK